MPVRSDKSYVEIPVTPTATVMSSGWERAAVVWRVPWLRFTLAVYRFRIAPLPSNSWLAETDTFRIIRNGPGPMLAYIREWPTATAVYGFVVCIAYAIGGAREYVPGLPPVIAIGLVTLLLYSLAKRLPGEASALPASTEFAFAPPGMIEATMPGLGFNRKPPSYMTAMLEVHPAAGRVILTPPSNLAPTVEGVNRFLVFTRWYDISPTLIKGETTPL